MILNVDAAEAIKMIDFGTHLGTTIDDMDVIFNVSFLKYLHDLDIVGNLRRE